MDYTGVLDGGAGIEALNALNPHDGFVFTDMNDFNKAVSSNAGLSTGGSDVAALTGGAALRLQSLESTLLRTIQEDKHFVLFNSLSQSMAGATSDEWTVKRAIGGFPGSAFNTELGTIPESQGTYERKVGAVKFLMTKRRVSVVQTSQKTLVDTVAEEKLDAIRELKTSVEWALFMGDSTVQPVEFDGLFKSILDYNDPDLIYDAKGDGLSFVAKEIINLAAAVRGQRRFGQVTDLYCSLAVQAQEIDQKLDPAWRVGSGEQIKIGTPVGGIRVSGGPPITPNGDVFITEGEMPFEVKTTETAAIVADAVSDGLTVPTVAVAVAVNAASKWLAAHAGLYYWGAEAIGQLGRTALAKSSQLAVVAGDRVEVTITHGASAKVTGFMLHRSRKNGTNNTNDFREMIRVARHPSNATTVYVDDNQNVPGTSPVFLLNQTPGANAVTLRRLLPLTMFPLFATDTAARLWALLFFCYLRVAKPMQLAMIRNVLPQYASWKPFN